MRIHKFPDAPPTARQHCRHYKYVRDPNDFKNSGPTCKIGKMVDAPGRTLPCLPDGTGCRFREEWTDEERAAWKEWSDASIERALALLNAIPDDGEKGEIDCPNCEGPADWVRAFNGHIHARCRTPNCSAFMQ